MKEIIAGEHCILTFVGIKVPFLPCAFGMVECNGYNDHEMDFIDVYFGRYPLRLENTKKSYEKTIQFYRSNNSKITS